LGGRTCRGAAGLCARDRRRTTEDTAIVSIIAILVFLGEFIWEFRRATRKDEGAAGLGSKQCRSKHAYLVVVVLVPIAFVVPAALVFIPPLMPLTPATLPHAVQFTTLVICPLAVASVFLDCLVEFVLCVSDSALTSVEVFCLKARHCGAKQNRCQNDEWEKRFYDGVH
jgi:hypothetical protein